ncbi:MAG TPA: MOSC N-terminal beta barrel domain-containing protein [Xanthobacteraceae bacterium]|nr:MOSC N-terminal beta barrel domain-containing protein [Xanthobacteraceae bacterium]
MAQLASIYRYPVKGLTPERLSSAELRAGEVINGDRLYAVENGPSGFDPAAPQWMPKAKFLCLMRNARLAALSARYDDASATLTIEKNGELLAAGDLKTPEGRRAIENFFETYMSGEKRGDLRILQAAGHSFSDLAKKVVSIINLDTVEDFSRALGQAVHPLRFRANLYLADLPAWSELDLIGKTLAIGGARLKILKCTERCAATEVNPDTALRDIDIPEILWKRRGNIDFGIYAEVIAGGRIAESDPVEIPA